MMHRCPHWSLNKVLWKREEEELNSDEKGQRGGGLCQLGLAGCVECHRWKEMKASSLKEPGEIRDSHIHLMVSFLEFRVLRAGM